MSPTRLRGAILLLAAGLAAGPASPARAAVDVPAGTEVLPLERIPGKVGKVRFGHAVHSRSHRRPDGSATRCRDCHHTLAADDPPVPFPPMRCSGCHAELGQPARVIDGKVARPMASLKPDGAVDYATILFHDYCRDCHKKVPREGAKWLGACKTCHERGISSESLHGRYDASPQPGTSLAWLRCPAGQRWTGGRCEGEARQLPLGAAAGACPDGFRLPSPAELLALLDGCQAGGAGPCRPCGRSPACAALFGDDGSVVWAAAGGGPAVAVALGEGLLRREEGEPTHAVRCVGPAEAGAAPKAPAARP
jgi:cytochrome c553